MCLDIYQYSEIMEWFEKCHIIDETFCINQLNGHYDTLRVSVFMNTNVLVTKISSKAVSIDHLTGCCKKCVNMGGCHRCALHSIKIYYGGDTQDGIAHLCPTNNAFNSPLHPTPSPLRWYKNIARIGNAVQRHSWLSGHYDCHDWGS